MITRKVKRYHFGWSIRVITTHFIEISEFKSDGDTAESLEILSTVIYNELESESRKIRPHSCFH